MHKTHEFLNYSKLIDNAMLDVVRKVLEYIALNQHIPENHCLYISFRTDDVKTQIPAKLRELYQEEMTIVLQHQFQNLFVQEQGFHVTLSFRGETEELYIPFHAITIFADPLAEFSIYFKYDPCPQPEVQSRSAPKVLGLDMNLSSEQKNQSAITSKINSTKGENKHNDDHEKIIVLDNFRKK